MQEQAIHLPESVHLEVNLPPVPKNKMTNEGAARGLRLQQRKEAILLEKIRLEEFSSNNEEPLKETGELLEPSTSDRQAPIVDFGGFPAVAAQNMVPVELLQGHDQEEVIHVPNIKAAANDNPNGAYTIQLETSYTDQIAAQGEQRWYNFQIAEQKKLTVYVSPVADAGIDNDLLLYKLDTTTYTLSLISKSQNRAAMYELLSYIADPGIYYICVVATTCSAPNNYTFLARISDIWDEQESDDSMALAKEQATEKIIKRTLDNSLDEDCTVWLVETTGNYRLEFFGIPENCNYQLQILSAAQQVITSVSKNTSTNFTNVAPGGYFMRVLSPDGVVDSAAQYGVLLIKIPDEVTDLNLYTCWLTDDQEHFVETVHVLPAKTQVKAVIGAFALFIDGIPFAKSALTFTSYRPNPSEYSSNNCSGSILDRGKIEGIAFGSYGSRQAPTVGGTLSNALVVTTKSGYYTSHHKLRVYDYSDFPSNPNSVITGSDQFHREYYQGYWNDRRDEVQMSWVINIETNAVVDLYVPNWFYGYPDNFGKVGSERPSFAYRNIVGEVYVPDYNA